MSGTLGSGRERIRLSSSIREILKRQWLSDAVIKAIMVIYLVYLL